MSVDIATVRWTIYTCVCSFMIPHMQCYVLIVKGEGNIFSHCLRLVAIGYGYVMLP